jgi:hypothetical protein
MLDKMWLEDISILTKKSRCTDYIIWKVTKTVAHLNNMSLLQSSVLNPSTAYSYHDRCIPLPPPFTMLIGLAYLT